MYCYTNLPTIYQDIRWLIHRNISEHCFLSPLTLSEFRTNSEYTDGLRLSSTCSSVRGAGAWGSGSTSFPHSTPFQACFMALLTASRLPFLAIIPPSLPQLTALACVTRKWPQPPIWSSCPSVLPLSPYFLQLLD